MTHISHFSELLFLEFGQSEESNTGRGEGPGCLNALVSWITSYKPITNTACVRALLVKYNKGYTRLTTASDKVYQLLAHCRWFSPGTAASSTTKTGRHDIAEILLKVALNIINQIKSNVSEEVQDRKI